jgi:hypothetical protein
MAALLIIVASSFGFGTALIAMLRLRIERLFLHCFFAIAAGMGMWMYLLLTLGYLRLFKPWILIGIAIAATAAVSILFLRRRELKGLLSPVRGMSWWGFVYAAVIFFMLFMTLAASFAPVTGGIRNDEICLHLSIVRQWLFHGSLAVLPDAISYQAGNAHLLFLLPAALGSPAGQRLMTWMCFVLCLWAVFIISRFFLDKNNALLASLIAAINPLIFRGAGLAFVDMQSSLFALAPVVAIFQYQRRRHYGWLVLCGLFLGAGVGIKPTNYIYAASFCVVSLTVALLRRTSWKELAVSVACIILLGGALSLHWPVRNMILSGSPVFPPPLALYKNGDLKPLRGGPAPFTYLEIKGYYEYVMSRYGDYRQSIVNGARFPWDITMNPGRFQIGDSIGTLFLCLFPFVFFFLPLGRIRWFLLSMALGSAVVLYFLVLPEARYYIGVFMLLCPLLAATARELDKNTITRGAVKAIIIVNCIFSLMVSIRIVGPSVQAAFDRTAAERMKRENIPFYEAFEYLRKNNITDVMVASAPQNLYYLPPRTQFHVDGSLMTHMSTMHGRYVLDIDLSQTLERKLSAASGDYAISLHSLPQNTILVFQGPDARILRLQ